MNLSAKEGAFYTAQGRCTDPADPKKVIPYPEALERAKAFLRRGSAGHYRKWNIYILDEEVWQSGMLNVTGYDQERRDGFLNRICELTNRKAAYVIEQRNVIDFKLLRRA